MNRNELTLRGIILGVAITAVFTAANVYLGLKVGLTFSTAIPAAVISMALLQRFGGVTIQENNIVQTVASAAGAMASVIFVLPGLVMVGWWTNFPFWLTFGICASGGILGVMFTIPLRRALVVQSDLPYPEGVAAAEVIKVGSGTRSGAQEETAGLKTLITGAVAAAGYSLAAAMKLAAAEVNAFFRIGPAATGIGGSLSLALLGAGHLMGVTVGVAILTGLIISWGIATPLLTVLHHVTGPAAEAATTIWKTQVRFIGAGTIAAAAVWTLGKLAGPIWTGLNNALAAQSRMQAGDETLPLTERDIPIGIMAIVSLACLIPVGFLVHAFLVGTVLSPHTGSLIAITIGYVIVGGFFVAAVCGYMAGLIGTSQSPVSGVGILAVLGSAVVLAALAKGTGWDPDGHALVAFALFVTSIIIAVAVSANDNLQDLKTGQLVGATPWCQQVALVIGVVAGSLVISPVLDLLNHAYGFAGAPNVVAVASQPLPAPQATLISTLAKGVIEGNLDWSLIGIGALLGAVLIAINETLRRTSRFSLPPLAVGLAIYLPTGVTTPVIVGAFAGWAYDRWCAQGKRPEAARRLGVLLASGLIVGESLFSVVLAGIIVATGKGEPFAVVQNFETPVTSLGLVGFVVLAFSLYRWTRALGESSGDS
ncbi:MAG: oligopeptide transporter, OPT family [Alphaproteobacteria bacterium]